MREYTPSLYIPPEGKYLWDWYAMLNEAVSRTKDGVCSLIPLTELYHWSLITGNMVSSLEYEILMSMDSAYVNEVNKELESIRSKYEEEQRRKI